MKGKEVCQGCGKPIEWGEKVIAVRYGTIGQTAHPHTRVSKDRVDYFHRGCQVAIASEAGQ